MMSSLYHNNNNNSSNNANNQQQQHAVGISSSTNNNHSSGRLLERDDEESVRVLLGGDDMYNNNQQQQQQPQHQHQQQQQYHHSHQQYQISGPPLSDYADPFHHHTSQQQQYHHQHHSQQQQQQQQQQYHHHHHQYHPYHTSSSGNGGAHSQHHHHQPQHSTFNGANYSQHAPALPHTPNLSLQSSLQNNYGGDDRMFIDILSPFPNTATVSAHIPSHVDPLYHQTPGFDDIGPPYHPHQQHHHEHHGYNHQYHHHEHHFNDYDAGVMTMVDCAPPFTSSSPPSQGIPFHQQNHHQQLPPQPQPPPASQQATTVASRRQSTRNTHSSSRSKHISPPGSTPSSPGVGSSSSSSSSSGAQVCGICKRDNVSFAKGYALTSENFAKYSVVFPHLVHTLEKGKICATCYNKCYAYHKKVKDDTGSNHSSPSNSRSASPTTSAASSPSESFLNGVGRRMFQNLRVATAISREVTSGTTSGNTSPTTPSSPSSSGSGTGSKCIICSKAKTNQSKLVWLTCCKCSKVCHRKCYSNNKRLKKSLYGQWTCPDCKVCEACGNTAEQIGLQTGLNCCKICDHSYCPTCQEGSLDSDDGWRCSACANSNASTNIDVVSPLKRRRTVDEDEDDEFGVTGYFDFPKMAKSEHTPTHTPLFTGGITTDAGAVVSSSRSSQGVVGSSVTAASGDDAQITIFVKYMYHQGDASRDKMKLEGEDDDSLSAQSSGDSGEEEEEIFSSFFFLARSMSTQYNHVLDLVVSLFNIRDLSRKYGPLKFGKLYLRQVDKQGRDERIELDQNVLNSIVDRDLIYCTLVPANSPASPLDVSSNDNSNLFPQ